MFGENNVEELDFNSDQMIPKAGGGISVVSGNLSGTVLCTFGGI
jgi:hypothetical protein